MRRIVIDARMYGLEHTGIGRYAINLISQLANIDQMNEYLILLKDPYFRTISLPKNFTKIYSPYNHYSLDEQLKLPFQLASLKPDLVHFLHVNIPIFYSKPFVVTIHDLTILNQNKQKELLPPHKYVAKKLYFSAVVYHAVHKSKSIITPSLDTKNKIIKSYTVSESKITPIYEGLTGFDLPKNPKNLMAPKTNYFIYVGNAFPHKNLERLLDAIKIVNQKQDVLLVLVTKENKFLTKLREEIKGKAMTNQVKIYSQISDSDLANLYKYSQAFVFPSLAEGFGLPGLEAISSGTLLCASDIPVFREIYKDNAIYFDPNSQESIANSLSLVLGLNESKRKLYIENGIKHAMSFSWEKTATKTLEVYKRTSYE